jgi:hypothetical protein
VHLGTFRDSREDLLARLFCGVHDHDVEVARAEVLRDSFQRDVIRWLI